MNQPLTMIIFITSSLSFILGQHWWNFEENLHPLKLRSFTPLPEQRYTHPLESNKYAPSANDVVVNIPKAGMGSFVGSSFRINYDQTWSQWSPQKGRLVNAFLGVPYAAPPVGDNRFRKPIPAYLDTRYSWYAKAYKPACLQLQNMAHQLYLDNLSEDCLYLNIFSPNRSWEDPSILYPVAVHIHGGSFMCGGSQNYPGFVLASKGIVVVTLNYRLGVLGFFSTGDSNSPGNFGLWDQLMAMQWVKENIKWFQGDPNEITLMGESAGAASVGIHTISPMSRDRGLFHRIIMSSGSELALWAVTDPNRTDRALRAIELGRTMNCSSVMTTEVESFQAAMYNYSKRPKDYWTGMPGENGKAKLPVAIRIDTTALIRCLRYTTRVEDLVESVNKIPPSNGIIDFMWNPVPDGGTGFLPIMPRLARRYGCFTKVPILAGVVRDEGSQALYYHHQRNGNFKMDQFDDSVARNVLKQFIERINVHRPNMTMEELYTLYNWWPDIGNNTARWKRFVAFVSDYEIIAPVEATVHSYASSHMVDKIYFYEFAYLSPFDPEIQPERGVYHGAEIPFVYGFPFLKTSPGIPDSNRVIKINEYDYHQDTNMSEFVMDLWVNFIKFGNPTPRPVKNITWPPYRLGEEAYLYIEKNSSIHFKFRPDEMNFWRERFYDLAEPIAPYLPVYYISNTEYKLATIILGCILALALIVIIIMVFRLLQSPKPHKFKHEVRLATPGASPGAAFRTAFKDAFTTRSTMRPPSPPSANKQYKLASYNFSEPDAPISLLQNANQYEPMTLSSRPTTYHAHPPPPPVPAGRDWRDTRSSHPTTGEHHQDSEKDELRNFTMDL